ncbi:MAG TPA: Holliday junction resolvase RuvX [Steroidobacteraceae bacterium]|nr:Holliday junction resolvase RuvX [Steroidobacteraceae bacterium]
MAGHPASTPQLILAFDFGTRRIGIAAGDTLTRTARGLSTLECARGTPWAEIDRIRADLQPSQLIVGLPHNMDGTPTALTEPARAFAAELAARYGKPVALVDERLSSREAEAELRNARAAGLKRRRATHADVDMIAARILLERWFAGEGEASTMRGHES